MEERSGEWMTSLEYDGQLGGWCRLNLYKHARGVSHKSTSSHNTHYLQRSLQSSPKPLPNPLSCSWAKLGWNLRILGFVVVLGVLLVPWACVHYG